MIVSAFKYRVGSLHDVHIDPGHGHSLPTGRPIERILREIFRRQAGEVIQHYRTRGIYDRPPNISSRWTMPMVDMLEPIIKQYWLHGAQQQWHRLFGSRRRSKAVGSIGIGFDIFNPRVLQMIRNAVFQFCDETNATATLQLNDAIQKLRDELQAGLQAGEAGPMLTARVQEIFASPDRAHAIAMSEASRAYHGGDLLAMQESGVVEKKSWLASSDACFAAGSKVLKVCNGKVVKVGIESLIVGDMVIGGSGRPRRVSAVLSKPYCGDMVDGPEFSATKDHKFLTTGGWRPIGEYTSQTFTGGVFNLVVSKSFDVPSALQKVSGLSFVFPSDLWFAVPIHAVTENNQMPVVNDKIDYPFVVHGNLLGVTNAVGLKDVGHNGLYVGSLMPNSTEISNYAFLRAAVGFSDAGRVFVKKLAAYGAHTSGLFFPVGIGWTLHPFAMSVIGASSRAKLPTFIDACVPLGHKRLLAKRTFASKNSWNFRVDAKRQIFALTTTKTSSSFDASWRDSVSLTTKAAFFPSLFVAFVRKLITAGKTAKTGSFTSAVSRYTKLLRAVLAYHVHCFVFRILRSIAKVTAKLSPPVDRFGWAGEFNGTVLANKSFFHQGIVQHRLTLARRFSNCTVYDIEVEGDHSFVLACGFVAHNCSRCLALDGMEIPLDEDFYVDPKGGPYARVPYPPRHPECMCSTVGVI